MKIKDGYVLREVADQYIVVPTGKEALNFNGMITLNGSGKVLWEKLKQETSIQELVNALINKYEVLYEVAVKDVYEFVEALRTKNILE
jgi:hypothetical protein